MINHVDRYHIYSIFDSQASIYYYIPKYQRAYTWSYKEWEMLYDDLYENNEEYFIGSIICINQRDSLHPVMEVIDGQQRLTTISLFLSAIYSKLISLKDCLSEDDEDVIPALRKSLRSSDSPNGLKLVPQVQDYNLDDYNSIMAETNLRTVPSPKKQYFSVRKIARCYRYFSDRLQREIDTSETKEDAIRRLLSVYNKVKKAMIVKIEVSSHSEAYVLFESLNHRGTPLTAIDLMKNLIMARAEFANMSTDDCFVHWQTLLGYLSDDYKIQERFFRQYYNAFRTKLNFPFAIEDNKKKYQLGIIATKSNLLNIYERLIKRDLASFIEEILEAGRIYSQIVFPEKDENITPWSKDLTELVHIQGAPSYVLLMYLLKNKDVLILEDSHICNIVRVLTKFFVHRNVTDYPATRDLTRMFMEIITEIEDQDTSGLVLCEHISEKLRDNCLNNDIFERRLKGNLYKENVDVTRFLLCALAEHEKTNEINGNLWNRYNSGTYIWTIEHIFPEGNNIPKCWVDMIAEGDEVLANEYLEKYVHTIGNLTLTGYNSSLSNLSFEKKRDRQDRNGNYVGYKNGFPINSDIATKDKWTVDDIITRTEKFVSEIIEMFKV